MNRIFLLLSILLLALHTDVFGQFVKGLSFGKYYTTEHIAEIHADKPISIKKSYNTVTVTLELSDEKYHYLLLELDNYTGLKGGKLNKISLSGIKYGEAEKLFDQFLMNYGEPSYGYVEHCDYDDIRTGRVIGWNKHCVYKNKFISGDGLSIGLNPFDIVYDGTYTFDIYYQGYKDATIIMAAPRSTDYSNPQQWQLTQTYGAGAMIKY